MPHIFIKKCGIGINPLKAINPFKLSRAKFTCRIIKKCGIDLLLIEDWFPLRAIKAYSHKEYGGCCNPLKKHLLLIEDWWTLIFLKNGAGGGPLNMRP
jgi:hypothetical protein